MREGVKGRVLEVVSVDIKADMFKYRVEVHLIKSLSW